MLTIGTSTIELKATSAEQDRCGASICTENGHFEPHAGL